MFPIRRAALRILSSPSTSFVARPRTITTFSPSSLRVLKQSTSVQFQRRWATGESEAPVSKLQPTPQEEVENAIHEDNSAQSINSSEQTQPAREVATENTAAPSAEAPVETANMTEATEEAIPAAEEPAASRDFSDRPPRDSRRNESRPFGDRQPRNNDPKRTVYVGNLFFDVTEDDLSKELSRFGTIKNVRLIRDARGLSKGFGYVGFEDVEQATRAIAGMNQQLFEGRRLSVQFAATDDDGPRAERQQVPQGARNPPSKTLFIGNMSWEMTDRDLNELFRGITNVIDVRVAIDRRTGQPRGFAHADFVDIKSAMEAEKVLQGKETYGRKLRIDYSYGPSNAPRNQARDEGRERGGRGSFERRSNDRPQRSERRDPGEEGY